jgi:hypothetical protein
MKEAIQSYIDACNKNIYEYLSIENAEERQRALDAAYKMKADFEKMLDSL